MKDLKRIMFFALTVFTLAMSTSCSKDDSKDENDQETTDFIKFKYQGKEYTYEPAYLASGSILIYGDEGRDNSYKRVGIWMPLSPKVGSHNVDYDLQNLTTTYWGDFSFNEEFSNANATSGTINITKVTDTRIEGTFTFSGTQNNKTFTVTDGSFSVERF